MEQHNESYRCIKSKLKNISHAKKYITNILQNYNNNDIIHDPLILELLTYHPIKYINTSNIEYLIIKIRPPYNNLALHYKYKDNNTIESISYTVCIKNLFGKYDKDKQHIENVITAFRNEIHLGAKTKYFINNTNIENNTFTGICDNCNISTNNINTDHHIITFKQLYNTFINNENITLLDIDVIENELNELRIKDDALAIKWRTFHDENATYRLLCKSCNSHFGSYG